MSVREAGRRYQQSPEGKLDHADRMRACRERSRAKKSARVTHQGPPQDGASVLSVLPLFQTDPAEVARPSTSGMEASDVPDESQAHPVCGN